MSELEHRNSETDRSKSYGTPPKRPARGGLTVARHFTAPGSTPFDEVQWERRTATIEGEGGKTYFKQENVEVPVFWSQQATNIVAQKYFRTKNGERESSVRQLIQRVVSAITLWGAKQGYFKTPADGSTFAHELTHLLLHQKLAFNSPVWFNVGVEERPQASACLPYDVRVSTTEGQIPIGELVELFNAPAAAPPEIYAYDRDGRPSRIRAAICNGKKTVMAIELADGSELPATGSHIVFYDSGDGQIREKQASDLEVGDSLILSRSVKTPIGRPVRLGRHTLTNDQAWAAGIMVGNGYSGRPDSATSDIWEVKINTVAERDRFLSVVGPAGLPFAVKEFHWGFLIRGYGAAGKAFWARLGLWDHTGDKRTPSWVYDADAVTLGAYLRGLFDTDGTVNQVSNDRVVVQLANTSRQVIDSAQSLLRLLGVYGSVGEYVDERPDANRRTNYTLSIQDMGSVEHFAERVGLTHEGKAAELAARRPNLDAAYRQDRVKVTGRRRGGPSLVYDIQVDSAEFWADGLLVHNCFINSVEDSLSSILDLAKVEGMIFKYGSGAGVNLSPLRASTERASNGAIASGPVSFMRGFDAFAAVIKSGGKCLAPGQRVYTETGPMPVEQLAAREGFVAISYDPPAGRYLAKRARAWVAGVKQVVRVVTDKGEFDLSSDHPMKLSSGEFIEAGSLRAGHSLFSCSIDLSEGYIRVHLRDGKKGKEHLHRMIARDVAKLDIHGMSVHHLDENRFNNTPGNLTVKSQSEHARDHGREQAERGEHVFQTGDFSSSGEENGMHASAPFWSDPEVDAYCAKQGEILRDSGRATEMQQLAARQKMLNTAFKVLNAGHKIDTFEDYVSGRKQVLGPIASIDGLRRKVQHTFGSHEAFVQEVAANNHRVQSVQVLGEMTVYDVEVDCPTLDDKSPASGHNFVIWSGDDLAGSGVVVANTRRAAKMIILNADHPDIRDFIACKAREEKKAWALIDAGYDGNYTGEAYSSVFFQNSNNSVRVTDEFMDAVIADRHWSTRTVLTGEIAETMRARELWRAIAAAADQCGDPGLQFDTTINDWHTCPETDRIHASNPCSEFMFLNNTACNLASLNLRKFQDQRGDFDAVGFKRAVEISILAQEIFVDNASYPTPKIEENSFAYRPLGLGYANLGALLMSRGLAYDSNEGRALAGTVTALMCGHAYAYSAQIARDVTGPFEGYEKNREPFLRVMQKHRNEVDKIDAALVPYGLMTAAREVWDDAIKTGTEHGYRNAQVTVLAPTGTIAFMMDCDTTGIEPDIALVKYKRLVGGGMLKIVNNTVPEALDHLGYSASDVQGIVDWIDEKETIEGTHWLKDEHLPIFDCAFKAKSGSRTISYMGHIRMMAACQPFVSGAISKTVNLPNSCTVEDIENAYMGAWRLGLKSIAIYRDGCKRSQPLSTSATSNADGTQGGNVVATPTAPAVSPPTRRRLPNDRESFTHHFSVAGHDGYLTGSYYPEDRALGEIFIRMAKEGSTVGGMMDSFATVTSLALQHGVPLPLLINKMRRTRFDPAGYTTNPDIRRASSIMDYIFTYLEKKLYGKVSVTPAPEETEVEVVPPPLSSPAGLPQYETDAPTCHECGTIMVRSGSCHRCDNCGATSGCS